MKNHVFNTDIAKTGGFGMISDVVPKKVNETFFIHARAGIHSLNSRFSIKYRKQTNSKDRYRKYVMMLKVINMIF